MQWLAALCVRRPVFASVLILSLTVIGVFSFAQLGIDQFPNVDIPTVLVTTRLPGAAPEQVESEVTDKIEEAVNTISGIDTLTSTSSEGVSQVVVSFAGEETPTSPRRRSATGSTASCRCSQGRSRSRSSRSAIRMRPGLDDCAHGQRAACATSRNTPTRCCGASSRAPTALDRSSCSGAAGGKSTSCSTPTGSAPRTSR